tara:strand:+ start:834 stop:989 length:156 start_codon:yes stop_codon:yes gene_type:complete
MPELDTALDRSASTLDRLLAAIVAAGTLEIDPTAGEAMMILFCAGQEPAEA